MLAEPGLPASITHPALPGETLRAYIGTPVYVRERVFGTLDFLDFGMALVDMDYRTLRVNAALCRILGYSRDELLSTDFQTITHPDDLSADLEKVQQMLDGKADSYRLRKRFIHRDGSIVWALLAVSVVRDADGEPIHFIAQIEDITEQVHARNALLVRQKQLETANQRLEELARTDALTGLPLSVMLVDVDHFKSYNDSFGHPEGDRALRVIAETLRDTCRDTDLVVRYGGEEFAALLPDTALEDAHGIAERMREAVGF